MKKISLIFTTLIVLVGCATNPVREITLSDGKKGFHTTCNGISTTWSKCFEVASQKCPNGFDAKDREQFVHDGFITRNFYFVCK